MREDEDKCPDCDVRDRVMAHIKNREIIIDPRVFLVEKIIFYFLGGFMVLVTGLAIFKVI